MANLITADGEILKEVGVMALRTPTGEFKESQPIYIKVSAKDVNPKTKMLPQEEKTNEDISKILAKKFGQYVNGCRAKGIKI